jgi:hypothetical protein
MDNKEDIQNIHAFDKDHNVVFIKDAESGRKGYFCMGCNREMEAVRSNIINRKQFFRHRAEAIKNQPKCSYNDETYRHKFAKDYLLTNKKVFVPALFKFPPNKEAGQPNLISAEQVIYAKYVEKELFFYEDQNCNIKWGKSLPSDKNTYLLLKPDIIFFDFNQKPILLIEIVATHKVSETKKIKLSRLGIDSIQITIPKDSIGEIEKVLNSTRLTKWIYNNEQESTEYIPVPNPNTNNVFAIDEIQRNIFEENYSCRKSKLSNLIRQIERCLESEQYRTVTSSIESELSRTSRNTEFNRGILEERREQYDSRFKRLRVGIDSKHEERRARINREKENFESEEERFREYCSGENEKFETEFNTNRERAEAKIIERYGNPKKEYRDLEGRYTTKKRELIDEEESIDRDISEVERNLIEFKSLISSETDSIQRIRRDISSVEREISTIARFEESERTNIERNIRKISDIESKFDEDKKRISAEFNRNRGELERKFQEGRKEFITTIETGIFKENEFTRGYKEHLDTTRQIENYIIARTNYLRHEKAWIFYRDGTYKNWDV